MTLNPDDEVILIPTMGFLHNGHFSLIKEAFRISRHVIVSIFLNPIQFENHKDFSLYPKSLDRDFKELKKLGVTAVFAPHSEEMYPKHFQTYISNECLAHSLCGKSRPSHFKGVCTIVMKLINLTKPHYVIFGRKDYQQFKIIEKMVDDLDVNTKILSSNTIREPNGLAISSRNHRLSEHHRLLAQNFFQSLSAGKKIFADGERSPQIIINKVKEQLLKIPDIQIDYIEIRSSTDLSKSTSTNIERSIIFGAITIDSIRLIDNLPLQ